MEIAFLLPVISQARFHKRITALKNLGVQVKVLAFKRDYYTGKTLPVGYNDLGHIEHEHYLARLGTLVGAIPKVRAALRGADVLYAFGLDMASLGWIASRGMNAPPKLIYEVGDIPGILLRNGLAGKAMRAVERFILRRSRLLVATSEAFVTDYYQGVQRMRETPHLVIENKLDTRQVDAERRFSPHQKLSGSPLRIGYFGLIRCPRSWEILKRVVQVSEGRVQVIVRGFNMGLENFEEEAGTVPGINYGGPYISPDDLPAMYGQVDMVWACFPYQGSGDRWARTNRFYEACFFQKPMFVQAGTEDSRIVEALGLGICLDLSDVARTLGAILSINDLDLAKWRQNMANLPKSIYIYTNEHEQLIREIK